MTKRQVNIRVDGDLLDAVTVKAKTREETVTEIVAGAFREYLAGTWAPAPQVTLKTSGGQDDTLHRKQDTPRAAGTASPLGAQPPARRCSHKGVRVIGGWCPACQRHVKPGGELA